MNKTFFWWLSPIIIAFIVSIPLSVWSSHAMVGRRFQKMGLLLIPEEVDPPQELRWLQETLEEQPADTTVLTVRGVRGFIQAVVDPLVNTLHIALLRSSRKVSSRVIQRRLALQDKVLTQGPQRLTSFEKMELLYDPMRMAALHHAVWELSDQHLASQWGLT